MPATRLRRALQAAPIFVCLMSAGPMLAEPANPVTFKVGEAAPANTFLAIWMAREAGLYDAQGLKLEIVHMVGGRTPLRSGAIAATLLGEPQRSEAFALGLRVVADLYAEKIPWLYSGLTVDRAYLGSNRDTLVRFMKATIEGNHLAIADDKRA